MKIIILTDHFGHGGAERVASLITNGLSSNKENEVHVCVFNDLNNYQVNKERIYFHLLTNKEKSHSYNAWLKIKNLTKIIKEENIDVIYTFGPIMASYAYIAKRLSGVKNIKFIASERNDPRKEPIEKWKKSIRNFCYNRADILVCQTPMAAELLQKQYGIKTKIVIIPNPITPNLPTWTGENSKEIITAARLTEQKNLPMLIDAFTLVIKKHPEYKLIIYGEGELRQQLEQKITHMNLQDSIFLPGFAKDIHHIMKNSYMYVSSSDYEGISNSMLEALGIGLPCICTNCPVGGASMFIDNGINGILTHVGNTYEMAGAIIKLIENKDIAKLYSNNSMKINQLLTLKSITEKWISLTKTNS